ncbi:arylsulfotransferase family protein [Tomitella cavernea]|uniref:Arylsulfotransferase ASST n=1 Tax=Tomitella cavernea TaxID=1387982 RepID=A0ABP9CAT4_9ACTN|nr:arylsulfotransferase family protein [Tomitella cavernea]
MAPGGAPPLGHVFLAPKQVGVPGPGQGPLIVDGAGEPVWIHPGDGVEFNIGFHPQTYRGRPVLAWWHGRIPYSHGYGSVTVLDEHYNLITEVHAGNGEQADLHEVTITDDDTMLLLAYSTRQADLGPIGGPADGWVYEGVVQEIAIDSGAVLMEWRSLAEIPVADSYFPLGGHGAHNDPYDYLHINSARVAPDGNIVISCRHTGTVYKIARDGSRVLWRLGGKSSDFPVPPDASFSWQHCAVQHADGTLSLFDNSLRTPPSPGAPSPASSALVLDVDEDARTVRLRRRLHHPVPLYADTQGSMQTLPDGSAFVGWGAAPYASLFDASGNMVWDAHIAEPWHSYRAHVDDWAGTPDDAPAVAARRARTGGVTVYASWNGATEVASWRILTGDAPGALHAVADMPRTGFESAAPVPDAQTWLAAAALDAAGNELGRSEPVRSAES